MGKFEDLHVWRIGRELYLGVCRLTGNGRFRGRRYLVDQLERASLSCSNLVAEGYARINWREQRQDFNVAIASAAEVQNLLHMVLGLGLCSGEQFNQLYDHAALFQKLAKSFLASDRRKPSPNAPTG